MKEGAPGTRSVISAASRAVRVWNTSCAHIAVMGLSPLAPIRWAMWHMAGTSSVRSMTSASCSRTAPGLGFAGGGVASTTRAKLSTNTPSSSLKRA